MRGAGRRVAIGAGAVAFVVIVGAMVACRHRILEEWYLYRLRNGDDETKEAAISWIFVHARAERALPALEEQALEDDPTLLVLQDDVHLGVAAHDFRDGLRSFKHLASCLSGACWIREILVIREFRGALVATSRIEPRRP
jgi:hypothetical protein